MDAQEMWDSALASSERLHKLKVVLENLGHYNLSFNDLLAIDQKLREQHIP